MAFVVLFAGRLLWRLWRISARTGRCTECTCLAACIVFLLLLGFGENYWEIPQALPLGLMVMKVLWARLLHQAERPADNELYLGVGGSASARSDARDLRPRRAVAEVGRANAHSDRTQQVPISRRRRRIPRSGRPAAVPAPATKSARLSSTTKPSGTTSGLVSGSEPPWRETPITACTSEIAAWRPDVVDIHNFFPLASPSVHYAARDSGIPVVQTLHNYRLLCPGATFLRDGRTCEDCTRHRVPWPGVVHRCYRDSLLGSAAVSLMISVHRALRTWQRVVTVFVAVSEFSRRKFVEGGFPESRIVVKPNFVPDPETPAREVRSFSMPGVFPLRRESIPC